MHDTFSGRRNDMDEFNFTEPPPVVPSINPPPEPAADPLPFRRPSDYYSAPDSNLRPLFPTLQVAADVGWEERRTALLVAHGDTALRAWRHRRKSSGQSDPSRSAK